MVSNGVVYIISQAPDASVSVDALDANRGTLLWKYVPQDSTGSDITPAVGNGAVIFRYSSHDGVHLCGLNAGTGVLLWDNVLQPWIIEMDNRIPNIASDVVYVEWSDVNFLGHFGAYDTATGVRLWDFSTWIESGRGLGYFSPAVANGKVYFANPPGGVWALSLDGIPVWFRGGREPTSSPAVANGVMYLAYHTSSGDNGVVALDARTGALIGRFGPVFGIQSSPAVTNDAMYVGAEDGNLYAWNINTRALMWTFPTGTGYLISSPAVANGVVYFGSWWSDNSVYALDASTGAVLWKYTTGDAIDSSPAVANGMVYIASGGWGYDAILYAFGLPSDQMSKDFSPPERPDPRLLQPDGSLQPKHASD